MPCNLMQQVLTQQYRKYNMCMQVTEIGLSSDCTETIRKTSLLRKCQSILTYVLTSNCNGTFPQN